MSHCRLEKAQVTFQDVAACFSEEEWKLLHIWQKELYKNVMNEIQQAFLSLGPLIASSVFSLKAQEKEDLCPVPNKDVKGPYEVPCPTSDNNFCYEVSFGINHETNQNQYEPQNTEEIDNNHCLNTESRICATSYMSVPVTGGGGTILALCGQDKKGLMKTRWNTGCTFHETEHETFPPNVTLIIKEEEDDEYTEQQCSVSIQSFGIPVGHGARNGKRSHENSLEFTETATPCTSLSRKSQIDGLQSSEKHTEFRHQQMTQVNQEMEGEETNPFESNFSNSDRFSVQHGDVKLERTGQNKGSENNDRNRDRLVCQQNNQHNWRQFEPNEYEKNAKEKGVFEIHQRTPTSEKLYQCTECKKMFNQKADVLRHQRTHTGKRPYICTQCHKCFSQKADVLRHQRTHTGERPYHCTECEKSFRQKSDLFRHVRTHTGDRPYVCSVCHKSFSQKGNLSLHSRTHR